MRKEGNSFHNTVRCAPLARPRARRRFPVDVDPTTMIEAERMLHLRRYLTLAVRSQLRAPQREMTTSRPPRRGGYVVGYVQRPRHVSLRPEIYVATCNRTYSTTVLQSSQSDDIGHKLTSFCDDVKMGRVSADGLREIIELCDKNDYPLPHGTGVLLLKCCGALLPDLQAAERDHLADQVRRKKGLAEEESVPHFKIFA